MSKADRFRKLGSTSPLPPEGHKLNVLSALTGENWDEDTTSSRADDHVTIDADSDITIPSDVSSDVSSDISSDIHSDVHSDVHSDGDITIAMQNEVVFSMYADVIQQPKYTDLHVRVSWYIERELADVVEEIHQLGVPKSQLLNDALRMYLQHMGRIQK